MPVLVLLSCVVVAVYLPQPDVLVMFDTYKSELNNLYRFYAGSSGMTLAVFSQMAKVCGAVVKAC